MSVATQPDVAGDLRRIHAVITRALDVSTRYCDGPADGATDAPSADEGFFIYLESLAGLLHAHHLVEDEIAFPRVREQVPQLPYDRLTDEHRQIASLVDDIRQTVAAGRGGDREHARHEIGRTIGHLSAIWHPHIAQEELHLTRDRLEAIMSPQEHESFSNQIGEHSRLHATPDYLVLPFMLYSLPAAERAVMASHLPPIVLERLVPVVWADKWAPMRPFLLAD